MNPMVNVEFMVPPLLQHQNVNKLQAFVIANGYIHFHEYLICINNGFVKKNAAF